MQHTLFQVTAVSFNDSGDQVISAGIDNAVKIWDLRKTTAPAHVLNGHTDTVTRYVEISWVSIHFLSLIYPSEACLCRLTARTC